MASTLEALLELQNIELQLVDIRRQLAMKERLVERQAAKLQAVRDRLAAEQQTLRRLQMDVDALDVDLKARSAQVARLREHLNSARTNKEYAAILAQLNNEKADASRLESRALELMGQVEEQRRKVAAHEEEEHAESQRLTDLQAQSGGAHETFSSKLEELEHRRDEAAERLNGNVSTLFDRLSEHYDGEVMAKIERTHPRRDEFICSGCHMTVSAENYNTALVRDDVQTCRNCGRILFVDRRR
jgi:hypothetical protein